jgi:hypothetical protein
MAEEHGAEHDFFGKPLASDSTMRTASFVPATTRSRSDSVLTCVLVGLRRYLPSL